MHPDRGRGTVVAIDPNDPRSKPFIVEYENGERHHYSLHSVNKLRMVTLALKVDVVAAMLAPSEVPAWKPPPTAPRVGRRKRASLEESDEQLGADGNVRAQPDGVSASRDTPGWFEIAAREEEQIRLVTGCGELRVAHKQLSTLKEKFAAVPEQKILRALVLFDGHAGRAHLALKQSCSGSRLSVSAGDINALSEACLPFCQRACPWPQGLICSCATC
jgi:hypothetical protein